MIPAAHGCPRALVLLTALAAVAIAAAQPAPARAAPGWGWPVSGEVITPYRNGADPYAGGQHRGIDVAAAVGTPVVAAVAGTVRFAGIAGSSGLTVSVRTADGRLDTSYLHLSSVQVSEGDTVSLGARVGAVGTTGMRSAATPHLHFGVREAGTRHAYLDPLDFLPPPGTPPVRELPRVPVPVGAPVRVHPAPRPVRVPSPSRARRRAPARRRVPAPARRRIRVPAGRRIRVPAGHRVPLPRVGPAPLPTAVPVTGRGRVPHRVPRPSRVPLGGPAPALAPRPAPEPAGGRPHPSPPDRRSTSPEPAGGPDLGWALACAGLLLAAGCLGRPGEGGPRGERRWSLGAFLRPLLGRRY